MAAAIGDLVLDSTHSFNYLSVIDSKKACAYWLSEPITGCIIVLDHGSLSKETRMRMGNQSLFLQNTGQKREVLTFQSQDIALKFLLKSIDAFFKM